MRSLSAVWGRHTAASASVGNRQSGRNASLPAKRKMRTCLYMMIVEALLVHAVVARLAASGVWGMAGGNRVGRQGEGWACLGSSGARGRCEGTPRRARPPRTAHPPAGSARAGSSPAPPRPHSPVLAPVRKTVVLAPSRIRAWLHSVIPPKRQQHRMLTCCSCAFRQTSRLKHARQWHNRAWAHVPCAVGPNGDGFGTLGDSYQRLHVTKHGIISG